MELARLLKKRRINDATSMILFKETPSCQKLALDEL